MMILVPMLLLTSVIYAKSDVKSLDKLDKEKIPVKESMLNTSDENYLTIGEAVIRDYKSFYSLDRLTRLGIGFGVGAVGANTNIDTQVQNWYQDNIRSKRTDDFSKTVKVFGEGKYLIPLSLLSASINYFDAESPVGVWGVYTSRAYLTGTPALLLMQKITGASRPGETDHDSKWRPFDDNNGVSGHAFMGAIPFLTLANMYDDNKVVKYLAYAASFATAWSRVNDDSHYLSQAALGWYMAFESVDAVFDADREKKNISITPMIGRDSYGVSVQMKW